MDVIHRSRPYRSLVKPHFTVWSASNVGCRHRGRSTSAFDRALVTGYREGSVWGSQAPMMVRGGQRETRSGRRKSPPARGKHAAHRPRPAGTSVGLCAANDRRTATVAGESCRLRLGLGRAAIIGGVGISSAPNGGRRHEDRCLPGRPAHAADPRPPRLETKERQFWW